MRTKSGRRPHRWGWEALESRVALSRAGGFGAVGDSLTDEYRFYPPDRSHARNWVETLAQTRDVNFGAYTTRDRAFPRDQGYANNWAVDSATTADVVASQLPGLVGQVASGKVAYASVNMGTDDFLLFAQRVANQTLEGRPPINFEARLALVASNARANFDRTVDALLAASPKARVIVATTPDIRQIPAVAQYLNIPIARQAADAIAKAQDAYNAHIRGVAEAQPRVALADVASRVVAFSADAAPSRSFGGTRIRLTTTGDEYRDAILADKIHPGTVVQGVIANTVIRAANTLGAAIRPLSPAQIVRRARFVASHFRTAR